MGDRNQGGSTRRTIMTVYRQDALRCASHLRLNGPTKASIVAKAAGVTRARAIMYADNYGWFERPPDSPPGVYGLTPKGYEALEHYADVLAALEGSDR